ncbi:MAG: SGNH/GDSL hydrolase family protein [Hespellia sp.]|nr:SGNH/GDSL hydrolase family protein [Hespellia sp.]
MKTILCYGDSNTYGLKSDLLTRYKREERWTGILQKLLGTEYYVIEEGLGGRTTVWDDPIEEYKNGKKYLLPCLDSHKPLDLVVIMLGTNDLKSRFSVTPFDISASMDNLVKTILKSDSGIDFESPKVLLVTPVPIHSVANRELDQMLPDMENRSEMLAEYYQGVAEKYQVDYINPGKQIEVNDTDGIHYTLKGHQQMAQILEEAIRKILI